MEILDDKQVNQHDEKFNSISKPAILKFGAIGALIITILRAFEFLVMPDLESESILTIVVGIFIALDYIILSTLAVKYSKKKNEGYITKKQAFWIAYMTGVGIALVNFLISILLALMTLDKTDLSGIGDVFNLPESGSTLNMVVVFAYATSCILGCVLGLIVALLISLILKKDRPKVHYTA